MAGDCICPRCSTVLPHRPGVPCFQIACPSCGSPMTRRFNVPDEGAPRRAAEASPKPAVDGEACAGCGDCVPTCPENAIEMRDDKAFIRADRCTNCRACIPACPVGAIK
jgi:electron transport complex protein RnfB